MSCGRLRINMEFSSPRRASSQYMRRKSLIAEKEGPLHLALTKLYLGISATTKDHRTAVVALAIRSVVYLMDFHVTDVTLDHGSGRDAIADHVIEQVQSYERDNMAKFIGAGLPSTLTDVCSSLCSRLWLELDTVPIVMPAESQRKKDFWKAKRVDEQADSMARRCIMHFGPSMAPIIQVGWHGAVQVAAGGRARLNTLEDYERICSHVSWETMAFYADKMRAKKTKVAFFSATPQGGGVALMRHALVRISRLLGLHVAWYVPKPRQSVFRITKNIHNILQGVAHPDQQVPAEDKAAIINWITDNAKRYWFDEGGPLRPPEEGGADIVIIDDPQMIGLIPMIKQAAKPRPVLFRSHIQVRSDLIAKDGSPQAEVWDFIWSHVKEADVFISHPISAFVPFAIPREKVAYLPATSDWLDGLNKDINMWDTGYYIHSYNAQCHTQRMTQLEWPARKYIIQVARFDPAKGIPTVIDSYAEFRRRFEETGSTNPPQLVICGNGSVDDPDGSMIYDQSLTQIETQYPYLQKDISVMRLDPDDQLLNVLMSNAHVALQLSTREGFEIKVSEALHAGRPVIATTAGGIPLQVKHGVNGYLVEPGDYKAVADHLMDLFIHDELHERMSLAAKAGLSDEVGTIGNALAWYFLASKFAVEDGFKCNGRWVNDMAREEAGKAYSEQENRLSRQFTA
ncbi:Trehalose synthase-like protein [Tolypocladium paradoxum]|uniref:Trehalose synthase-like protein n=1 Tax=Tolypocladium paradoxum TaxID=94208 RepID=A0A2S4L9Z4_9HYPO|nr:Trehalose synthase-like protein [Tolypocladium paradoxum]